MSENKHWNNSTFSPHLSKRGYFSCGYKDGKEDGRLEKIPTFDKLRSLMIESLENPEKKKTLPDSWAKLEFATQKNTNIDILIKHFAFHITLMLKTENERK